jgi:hypothetical protein
MKLRMITVAVLIALMSLLLAPAQTSAKPKPRGPVPIPVTGEGTFNGQFLIESFALTSDNKGLVAVGDLFDTDGNEIQSNISWPVDLAATQERNAPAAVGDFNALVTCEILDLVLGPLDLNLLGLRVQLSQVILTITGETGALLGDLLCGLLGGLDLGLLQGLLGSLNELLGNLGGLLFGIAAVAAILDGLMQVANFTRAGNQILTNGTLGNQVVSEPLDLAASNGTCEILNLVIGPLDLNLLGLVIELNQVTLTITAEQGGGLLGDLLCSVADLLGGPASLTGLTALLNNILRALGGA